MKKSERGCLINRLRKTGTILLCFPLLLTGCSMSLDSAAHSETRQTDSINLQKDKLDEEVQNSQTDFSSDISKEDESWKDDSDRIYSDEEAYDEDYDPDPNLEDFAQAIDMLIPRLEAEYADMELNVDAVDYVWISKEYIEELDYNSRKNVFFGYTLKEAAQIMGDKPYVFTLGEDNETTVCELADYDDRYEQALKDAAIGAGLITGLVGITILLPGSVPVVITTAVSGTATGAIGMGTSSMLSSALMALISGYIDGVDSQEMQKRIVSAIG